MFFGVPLSPRPVPPQSSRQSYNASSIYQISSQTTNIHPPENPNNSIFSSPRKQKFLSSNNPYCPSQPLSNTRIEQLYETLKNERVDDSEVNRIINRIHQRIQLLSPNRTKNPFTSRANYILPENNQANRTMALRVSRNLSDYERYDHVDRNGFDQRDRKIAELQEKLKSIAELIQSRKKDE